MLILLRLHGQLQDNSSPITVGDPRTNLPNILFWRIHGFIEWKWQQFEKSRSRPADQQRWYDQYAAKYKAHMENMSKGVAPSTGRSLSSIDIGRQLLQYKPRRGRQAGGEDTAGQETTGRKRAGDILRGGRAATPKSGPSKWTPDLHRPGSFLYNQSQRKAVTSLNHRRKKVLVPRQVLAEVRSAMFNDRVQCWRYQTGTTSTLCPDGKNSDPKVRVNVPRPGDRRPLQPYRRD
jgi:hypothetical protein